jgi:hypothetical protein
MKRFLLFLVFCIPLFSFTDTRSYIWVNPQVVSDIAPYDAALSSADMDKYRYFDQRNTLHFDNGLDLILLSANELTALGVSFNRDHVRTAVPAFDTHSVFKLTSNGTLVEVMTRSKIK